MDCPRHHHRLAQKHHHSHAYDGCDSCGGYFIRKGLLHESLGHAHGQGASRIDYAALPASFLKCPADKVPMHVLVFKEVEIDLCPVCEGVWLDAGEFEAIRRQQKRRKGREDSDEPDEPDLSSVEGEAPPSRPADADAGSDVDLGRVVEFVRDAVGSIFDGF